MFFQRGSGLWSSRGRGVGRGIASRALSGAAARVPGQAISPGGIASHGCRAGCQRGDGSGIGKARGQLGQGVALSQPQGAFPVKARARLGAQGIALAGKCRGSSRHQSLARSQRLIA